MNPVGTAQYSQDHSDTELRAVLGVHAPEVAVHGRYGMPQDEQFEWPSFETVLRDVATSDPARPTTETPPTLEEATSPPEELLVEPDWSDADSGDSAYVLDDLLPAPLAPLDFDTTSVRALLEPRSKAPVEDFEVGALEPLTPPSVLDLDVDLVEETAFAETVADDDPVEAPDPVEAVESLETHEPDPVLEPESVFDLAFQPDDPVQVAELPDAIIAEDTFADTPILEDVDGIEIPGTEDVATEVFEDLSLESELTFENTPADFDDLAVDTSTPDSVSIEELPSGAVFQLDETALSDIEPAAVEEFSAPTIDLFDLQVSSDEVEAQRIDEFGEDFYASGLIDQLSVDEPTGFDSVATANAIEGELNELNDLTSLEPDFEVDSCVEDETADLYHLDNVIPIRPDTSDSSLDDLDDEKGVPPSPQSGPSPARVSHTGWVGLDNAEPAEPVKASDPDPWAHMRPDDEPAQQGFWAKVFGGDDRKRAKARRLAQKNTSESDAEASTPAPDISFDSACPNCGSQCQVDLDDPIGQRVHVSCPSCDHMWNTPYINAPTG